MKRISRQDFFRLLGKDNPELKMLIRQVSLIDRSAPISFIRKDGDLVETIKTLCENNDYPVYDRTLGMVFGLYEGRHELLRNILGCYHGRDFGLNPYVAADKWLFEKHGFYISSMETHTVVVAEDFQPDRAEEAVLRHFNVKEIDDSVWRLREPITSERI